MDILTSACMHVLISAQHDFLWLSDQYMHAVITCIQLSTGFQGNLAGQGRRSRERIIYVIPHDLCTQSSIANITDKL